MKRLLLAGVGLAAVAATSALAADMPPGDRCRRRVRRPTCRSSPGTASTSVSTPATASATRTGPTPSPRPRPASFNVNGALVGGTTGLQSATRRRRCRPRGATSTGATSRARPRPTASAPARPPTTGLAPRAGGRLRLRSFPALPHRRRGLRRHQGHGRRRRQRFKATKVGWTAGAGLEYAFIDHWSAKLEYLYVDLGKATCDAVCSGGDPFDVTFNTSIVRAGVNYKF